MIGLSLGAAVLLGLGSTLHCFAMCGGIIGALSAGLPGTELPAGRRLLLVAGFNIGRILSYAIAGMLAGAAGGIVITAAPAARPGLQIVAATILVLVGLHLGGWFPGMTWLEVAGSKIWRRLQPAGALFLPVDTLVKALILGGLWGWLPCGLVYSTLLWTTAHADPVFGAAAMFAFGLGTLPGMTLAGLAAHDLSSVRHRPVLRRAAAVLIVALGVASAVVALRDPGAHPPHVQG